LLGKVILDALGYLITEGIPAAIIGLPKAIGAVDRGFRNAVFDKITGKSTSGIKTNSSLAAVNQIKTDPLQATKEQSQQNQMLFGIKNAINAINNLAENGITANAYLDGDKVSSGLARSNRYG